MNKLTTRQIDNNLSCVAIAKTSDDEKIVRVSRGRRTQVGYDAINRRWEITRLTIREGGHAIAGRTYKSVSGEPWEGIYI